MTWVKICGTTNLRDAEFSLVAGADALGFIFAPSPRKVDITAAADIIAPLSGHAEMIGVFVNETPERVAEIADQVVLSGVQLHGEELPDSLPEFRRTLGGRKIIKVLHAADLLGDGGGKLSEYLAARESLDAILLDSGSAQQRGGTGIAYDWNRVLPIAAEIRKAMPLIVAGGLNAGNVARAIEFFDPWGVDVVSGVESRAGVKDEMLVKEFITTARQTAASTKQRD
jgi:phosphoribosylanthranilate isomerase